MEICYYTQKSNGEGLVGRCLELFSLEKEIPIFQKNETKSDITEVQNKIEDTEFPTDLAFSTDITQYLNELNLKIDQTTYYKTELKFPPFLSSVQRTLQKDGKCRRI